MSNKLKSDFKNIKTRYIDLTIKDETGNRVNSLELISQNKNKIFLCAEAGAGKTYTLKHIALSLIEQAEFKLPIYISISDISNIDNIAKFFKKLLPKPLTDNFDQLMKSNSIVWLIDGINEKDSLFIKEFLKETKLIFEKYQNISVLISGRPENINDLNFKNFEKYFILPLNVNEKTKFTKIFCETKELQNLMRKICQNKEIELLTGLPFFYNLFGNLKDSTFTLNTFTLREFWNFASLGIEKKSLKIKENNRINYRTIIKKAALKLINEYGEKISIKEFEKIISDHNPRWSGADCENAFGEIKNIFSFILKIQKDYVYFSHDLFRDYYAAACLFEKCNKDDIDNFIKNKEIINCQHVIKFYTMLASESDAQYFIEKLLNRNIYLSALCINASSITNETRNILKNKIVKKIKNIESSNNLEEIREALLAAVELNITDKIIEMIEKTFKFYPDINFPFNLWSNFDVSKVIEVLEMALKNISDIKIKTFESLFYNLEEKKFTEILSDEQNKKLIEIFEKIYLTDNKNLKYDRNICAAFLLLAFDINFSGLKIDNLINLIKNLIISEKINEIVLGFRLIENYKKYFDENKILNEFIKYLNSHVNLLIQEIKNAINYAVATKKVVFGPQIPSIESFDNYLKIVKSFKALIKINKLYLISEPFHKLFNYLGNCQEYVMTNDLIGMTIYEKKFIEFLYAEIDLDGFCSIEELYNPLFRKFCYLKELIDYCLGRNIKHVAEIIQNCNLKDLKHRGFNESILKILKNNEYEEVFYLLNYINFELSTGDEELVKKIDFNNRFKKDPIMTAAYICDLNSDVSIKNIVDIDELINTLLNKCYEKNIFYLERTQNFSDNIFYYAISLIKKFNLKDKFQKSLNKALNYVLKSEELSSFLNGINLLFYETIDKEKEQYKENFKKFFDEEHFENLNFKNTALPKFSKVQASSKFNKYLKKCEYEKILNSALNSEIDINLKDSIILKSILKIKFYYNFSDVDMIRKIKFLYLLFKTSNFNEGYRLFRIMRFSLNSNVVPENYKCEYEKISDEILDILLKNEKYEIYSELIINSGLILRYNKQLKNVLKKLSRSNDDELRRSSLALLEFLPE